MAGAEATDAPEAEVTAIAGNDDDDDSDGEEKECAPEDPAATAGLDAGAAGVMVEDGCAEVGAAAICEADSCAAGTEPELWPRCPDSVSRFSR